MAQHIEVPERVNSEPEECASEKYFNEASVYK